LVDTGSADAIPVTQDKTFDLSLSGNEPGTTVTYEKSLNGGTTWTSTTASQSGLADGDYKFHAIVTDPAGNSSTSNVIEVKVDNTAPVAGTLAFAGLTDSGTTDTIPVKIGRASSRESVDDTDANGDG